MGSGHRGESGKVRYAVVGLGWVAQAAVLPGFANAEGNSELVGLVSGDPGKLGPLAGRYGVEKTYSYEQFDDCLAGVDAVYLAVPNHEHRRFAEAAARAGVHVLSEKPLADSEEDARAIVDACRAGGVRLMVAYRLHVQPAFLRAVEVARSGRIGAPRLFQSHFVEPIPAGDIRLKASHGGGPLDYIGIYCVNAARGLFGAEPVEAVAFSGRDAADARFSEVDENTTALLRFPEGRLATFTCGFNSPYRAEFRLSGTRGDVFVDRAYAMTGAIRSVVTAGEDSEAIDHPDCDQFGAQVAYFSSCILSGRDPQPGGAEGLADVRIVEALRRSSASGRPVTLDPIEPPSRPDPANAACLPPVEKAALVKVKAPF